MGCKLRCLNFISRDCTITQLCLLINFDDNNFIQNFEPIHHNSLCFANLEFDKRISIYFTLISDYNCTNKLLRNS